MKKVTIFFLFALLYQLAAAQQSSIPYGDNPKAGRYVNVRGIKMYVEVYGTGQPLLMIHGNGGSMSAFKNNVPYFARKYQVILADSRAQGKSVDHRDSLSFEMMADDFAALLDQMHIKSCYVIGWSDGGINALLLAMRHPAKVIKLASTGANLVPDSTGIIAPEWNAMVKRYRAGRYKVRITDQQKNNWKIFMLDYVQPHIPAVALHRIQCPSLIIGGDHDVIPVLHTVTIYRHIPSAYLWIVPNSGHPTLIEHRDEFNKTVDDFFTKPFHKF
jgi:pimeloyl-ACP methyl ester carboxylesterase